MVGIVGSGRYGEIWWEWWDHSFVHGETGGHGEIIMWMITFLTGRHFTQNLS